MPVVALDEARVGVPVKGAPPRPPVLPISASA
jgi:hypothetical protein